MGDLVVIAFDDQSKADNALKTLKRLQQWDYVVNLEDAVVVVKNEAGEVKLKQGFSPTGGGAVTTGFWGLRFGAALGLPLAGAIAGAATGGVAGSLSDFGIEDDFIKEIGETLKPDTSAIFALVHWAAADQVREEMKEFNGKVIASSLSEEAEARIQASMQGDDS